MRVLQGRELTRVILTVLFIGALMAATFWILRPFLGAIIWAAMIVVSTWGPMQTVQKWLGGRRWAAVSVMTFLLLLVLIVPLSAAIGTVVANADEIVDWAKEVRDFKLPPPPSWVSDIPFAGERVAKTWQDAAGQGFDSLRGRVAPYAGDLTKWFVSEIGSFGAVFIQFLLTVLAAGVLYAHGEGAAEWMLRFGERLGGERGEAAVRLSAQAIRSVARGVVVTALVQSLVGGVGLWIADVPFAPLLTAFMFLLAVAQLGAAPVLVLATIWLYWSGSPGMGTFLLVVTVIASTLDNFLRPFLIKQGAAELPLLLIFIGVIGGLIAFGLIGIFIGPLVLAVAHTLLTAWLYGVDEAKR